MAIPGGRPHPARGRSGSRPPRLPVVAAAASPRGSRPRTSSATRVRTTQARFAENLPIIPGMVAEVDIITGKKSVLVYLLKPVLRAKSVALTER